MDRGVGHPGALDQREQRRGAPDAAARSHARPGRQARNVVVPWIACPVEEIECGIGEP
jgi:hypothetical protein